MRSCYEKQQRRERHEEERYPKEPGDPDRPVHKRPPSAVSSSASVE
jgi:hypothetical protein